MSAFDEDSDAAAKLTYEIREKGFGTCEECGKKTMGRSNQLCSRCGGIAINDLLGIPYQFFLNPASHTLTDLRTGKVTKDVRGFPGPLGKLVYFEMKKERS
jgi:hypothetical protein